MPNDGKTDKNTMKDILLREKKFHESRSTASLSTATTGTGGSQSDHMRSSRGRSTTSYPRMYYSSDSISVSLPPGSDILHDKYRADSQTLEEYRAKPSLSDKDYFSEPPTTTKSIPSIKRESSQRSTMSNRPHYYL